MIFPVNLAVVQTRDAARLNVEAFRKATLARNFDWFEKTYAPNYIQIVGPTKIDRKAALASLRKGLTKSPVKSLEAKVTRVKDLPNGFVATAAFKGTMRGLGNGVPITLFASWHDDQTWVKAKGRWLLRSTRTYDFEREIESR